MRVRVRLFAGLRERAGRDELELELPEGACVADALAQVAHLAPDITLVLAVNRIYAEGDTPLAEGDELAVVPPVSGGADLETPRDPVVHAALRDGPLSLDHLAVRVADPRAGATVTFSGTTRGVTHLDYEAYGEMALERIAAIVAEAVARHGLCAGAAEHRVGRVALGEASVIVAASAPHRPEAFAGGREMIDRIKAEAPIWKREEGEWVAGVVPSMVATVPTTVLDVTLDERLEHGSRAELRLGAQAAAARIGWLGGHFHQLRVEEPVIARHGDAILLAGADGMHTEGTVLDPRARRHGPGNDVLVHLTRLRHALEPAGGDAPSDDPPG